MASSRVQVVLATPADYERMAEIIMSAFADDPQHHVLFPASDGDTRSPEDMAKEMETTVSEEHYILLKAVILDPKNGEEKIVGVGQWLPPAYKRPPVTEAPAGSDKELFLKFFGMLEAKQNKLMGDQPHWYCHLIVVDPDFQRQGIGAALMQWGIHEADKQGVPSYIEASPAGLGLYKKLGYLEEDVVLFEDRKGNVNVNMSYKTVCMPRPVAK